LVCLSFRVIVQHFGKDLRTIPSSHIKAHLDAHLLRDPAPRSPLSGDAAEAPPARRVGDVEVERVRAPTCVGYFEELGRALENGEESPAIKIESVRKR